MTDPIMAMQAVTSAFSSGPELSGLKPTLTKLRELLGGRLDVQSGVAIESHDSAVNLQLRLVGNVMQITFLDPKPQVSIQYIIQLVRDLDGVRIFEDHLEIDIADFPSPKFPIVS
jgi:hypothetical protein